jgi:hypothetical protein
VDFDDLVAVGVIALIVAMLAVSVTSVAMRLSTERRCLEAGWRDSKVTWTLGRYCVAREDQSDVVKPLSYAEQHPR